MAYTLEPEIVKGSKPEDSFQSGVLQETMAMLSSMQDRGDVDEFFLIPGMGFSLAVFIKKPSGDKVVFVDLKMFMGARPRVVEVGDNHGGGPEMDLLQLNTSRMSMAEDIFRWALVDITKSRGNKRYSIFSTSQAKDALAGGINKKKQNSVKLGPLMTFPMTWDELSRKLEEFLAA